MTIPSTLLGDLTPEAFLAEYWQKKPLLVRGALPEFASPLTPEELAGLACEDGVTSRLIMEEGGASPWEVRFGPFDEETFLALPETHWSLLVQEVNRLVPGAARLLDAFAFIPNWRIDDVMVSYAPNQGTVGAHLDNYDVFLLQGWGRRRWQIEHTPRQDADFVPDLDVRLLQDFAPEAEWILEPGDLLYLPPRIPHYGVALGEGMTYSIGFRAPSSDELVMGFLSHVAERADPQARYRDPELEAPTHPGEISSAAREKIRSMLRRLVQDDAAIDRWFGQHMTTPQRSTHRPVPEPPYAPGELVEALEEGAVLRRSAVSDFAFIPRDDGATLFVAGAAYPLDEERAALLTGPEPLSAETLAPHLDDGALLTLLAELVNTGCLIVHEAQR